MSHFILDTMDERKLERAAAVNIKRLHAYVGELEEQLRQVQALVGTGGSGGLTAAQVQLMIENALAVPPVPPLRDPITPTGGPPTPPAPTPDLDPQFGTGAIHVSGQTFIDATGAIWKWKGFTDYALYYHYLLAGGSAGGGAAAIAPILAERAGLGYNTLRVFSMAWGGGDNFDPAAYPAYYTDLPIFAALLAASGFQLELTVFALTRDVPSMTTVAIKVAHFTQCAAALAASPNVFLEVGNEYTAPENGWTPGIVTRPNGLLTSAGSAGIGTNPPRPAWDFVGVHTDRGTEWPRKAHDLLDIRDGVDGFIVGVKRPVVADEPMGAGEVNIPGSRSTDANDFYWFAATSMLLGAGATFHSEDGSFSDPLGPLQLTAAAAFSQAIDDVPAQAQTWKYTRGGLPDFPLTDDPTWMLRQYARIGSTQAVAVIIRPTGLWPGPIPVAPWIIDAMAGPGGNTLVYLSRPFVALGPTASSIRNEVPPNVIDGVNQDFNVVIPYQANSLIVYLNGLRQKPGAIFDYIETSNTTFQMNAAPVPGDFIIIDYLTL